MEIYPIVVALSVLTFVQGEVTELSTSDLERTMTFLQNDDVTVKIVNELLDLGFNPQVQAIMHMLFNHLLIVRWLFSNDDVELKSMPQFPQLESERVFESLSTDEEKEAFKKSTHTTTLN